MTKPASGRYTRVPYERIQELVETDGFQAALRVVLATPETPEAPRSSYNPARAEYMRRYRARRRELLARALLLVLLCATTTADAHLCWDRADGYSYRVYWAQVGSVTELADPAAGITRVVTAPPAWRACQVMAFPATICIGAECCAEIAYPPGDLIFYFVVARDDVTGAESLAGGKTAQVEPCLSLSPS